VAADCASAFDHLADPVASAFSRKKRAAFRRKIPAFLLLWLLFGSVASAHDIPTDVTVQAFVKPAGTRLQVLVRVPLKAMRDVSFPLREQGFLDLAHADMFLRDAAVVWISGDVEIYENDVRVSPPVLTAVRVSLPSDRSFVSYDDALAHLSGSRLPVNTDIPWDQAMMDVLFEYPIASERSSFSIHPTFARLGLRVVTVLRFLPPGGAVRALEFTGDPGLVRLDPRWHQAAFQFIRLGFVHILDGTDHLLFLLCLVIPFRRIKPLVVVVTAFTVAHSLTLIASAWNGGPAGLWFPPLVETLIAASILYMALENIVLAARRDDDREARGAMALSWARDRRWLMAFAFGLVHGLGFSFALRESLQFAGSHLLTSLLSFNVGVELGQLAVLAVMVPALHVLFRFVVPERIGTIVLSALVAHTAWHWTGDRWDRLHQFAWPAMDAALLASVVRGLMLLVLAGIVAWIFFGVLARRPDGTTIADDPRERGA
jgi:uncharacterized membrane-anchored protein YitT (DUF2179 family)